MPPPIPFKARAANSLAAAVLAGEWSRRAVSAELRRLLGRSTAHLHRSICRQVFRHYNARTPPAADRLARTLAASETFERALALSGIRAPAIPLVLDPPRFAPDPALAGLAVPALATEGDLARFLALTPEELDWFADIRRPDRAPSPLLHHYRHAFVAKRIGPPRLLEAPKPDLKRLQRRILHEILDAVPTHPAAHGFVRGRSPLSAVQRHAGEAVTVSLDLRNFFLETRASRIHALFRALGYPAGVARLLTGLCSTRTPRAVFEGQSQGRQHDKATIARFAGRHLPQGAPTSPALANLAVFGLDRRLAGLVERFGGAYTRYADDLMLSGDAGFADRLGAVLPAIETIVRDEGYALNGPKTRIMRNGARQHLLGIIVNRHCNIERAAYDTLKATLHNAARSGPASQNRAGHPDFRAHLAGRIAWVETVNRPRGLKLRALFERIAWPAASSDGVDETPS